MYSKARSQKSGLLVLSASGPELKGISWIGDLGYSYCYSFKVDPTTTTPSELRSLPSKSLLGNLRREEFYLTPALSFYRGPLPPKQEREFLDSYCMVYRFIVGVGHPPTPFEGGPFCHCYSYCCSPIVAVVQLPLLNQGGELCYYYS